MRRRQICLLSILAGTAVMALAFSTGPPIKRTSVPVDGGLNCTACHKTYAPANSDPSGKVAIQAAPYTPGVKQTIRVSVTHPLAQRWGFQLTARLTSDEARQAGSFDVTDQIRVQCDSTPASDAPCNGALEFASHKRNATIDSTFPGTSGGHTWEIQWTPPSTDVGEVIFYASGNAANGNGNFNGDRIYTTHTRIASVDGCPFSAKPSIAAVVNGASFKPGIGFDTMISIFGSGFANTGVARNAEQADFVNSRFPAEMSCLSVEVNGTDVPLTYVSEHQVNAQAPAVVLSGPVMVEVRQNIGRSREARTQLAGVRMDQFAPAFFLIGTSTSIAARHLDMSPVADPSIAAGGTPAKPGEVIALFGTGFGVTEPVWQAGELPTSKATVDAQFTVTIGGVTLKPEDVSYAGLSPGSISGLYQFNLRVPDGAPDGNVPVTIRIAGAATQDGVTIPVKRN